MFFSSRSSLVLLNAFIFFTVAVLPSGVHLASCLVSPACDCIQRGTFDSEWLQINKPNVYQQNNQYVFTIPEITYPNCTAIYSSCPTNAQMVSIYPNGSIYVIANPFNLENIYCQDKLWENSGLAGNTNENIKATNISCRVHV